MKMWFDQLKVIAELYDSYHLVYNFIINFKFHCVDNVVITMLVLVTIIDQSKRRDVVSNNTLTVDTNC